jgi:hypothetical protein
MLLTFDMQHAIFDIDINKGVDMREMLLVGGVVVKVDDCDWCRLMKYGWSVRRGNGNRTRYAWTEVGGKRVSMQSMVWGSSGVSHVDDDGLNNQRGNLRAAVRKEGLTFDRARPYYDARQRLRPWKVIMAGKYHGSFVTLEEAQAYIDENYMKRDEALVVSPGRKRDRENPHRSTVWRRKKLATLKDS